MLKTPNNPHDMISIQKEVICSLLLDVWKLPTPEIAFLRIDQELESSFNKTLYGEYFFGSKYISQSIDLNKFFSLKKKTNRNVVANSSDLLKIALFDIWVANDDRKPSNNNLLLCPVESKYQITCIDHAYTFASLAFKDLISDDVLFSYNDSILFTPIGREVFKAEGVEKDYMDNLVDFFYLCVKNSEKQIDESLAVFPKELLLSSQDVESLKEFLFNPERLKLIIEFYYSILKDIK